MSGLFKKLIDYPVRKRIANMFFEIPEKQTEEPISIAEGWELYAKNYECRPDQYLGDEWNEPEEYGIDVAANQIVSSLDERVFAPFLGFCEVIIEIGSGGGRFTELLLPKCKKLIATDTSKTMLNLLRNRFKNSQNIEYLLLDGKGLSPVPDNSLDAAFSFDVFVHLQHWDIFNYLCEINRVLKYDGKAIIHHSNTFSELGWRKFCRELPRQINKCKDSGSFMLMTPEVMKEFILRAGLVLEECVTNVIQRDCICLIKKPAKQNDSS